MTDDTGRMAELGQAFNLGKAVFVAYPGVFDHWGDALYWAAVHGWVAAGGPDPDPQATVTPCDGQVRDLVELLGFMLTGDPMVRAAFRDGYEDAELEAMRG